jgi:GT2 family glycosyltransferase
MAKPVISFITVTYNSARTIHDCLEAALAQPQAEVIVVDNASADTTLEIVRTFPRAKLVVSGTNLGFNGGNQLGVEQAQGDILVFLNPDAILSSDYTDKILAEFDRLPKVAVIGCQIMEADGSLSRTSSGLPTLRSHLYEHSGYQVIFPRSRAYHHDYVLADWDRQSSRIVGAVAGSCLAVRRTALEQCGGLDTHYFLFYEEVDLSRRILKKLGLHTYYTVATATKHIGKVSTKEVSNAKIDQFYWDSRDYYMRKFYGSAYLLAFKVLCKFFNALAKLKRRLVR